MNTSKRYPPEFRERAVRLVQEAQKDDLSQWAAMQSISTKLGCTPETLDPGVPILKSLQLRHRVLRQPTVIRLDRGRLNGAERYYCYKSASAFEGW